MTVGAGLDSVPKPITPGPEMAALARFHTDVTWTGSIQAGGMGPGRPAMTAVGWGKHEPIQDGRWIVGTYQQDQFLPDNTLRADLAAALGRRLGSHRRRVPGDARGQLRACRRHARLDRGGPAHLRDPR